MRKTKRGSILVENIVFIILNLIFLAILVLFIFRQGFGAIVLEQSYSKQIALLIDAAKPIMQINLDMTRAKKLAEKNGIAFSKIINRDNNNLITENIITIRLSDVGSRKGYSYSFFNDVQVYAYPDPNDDSSYVFTINEKDKNE